MLTFFTLVVVPALIGGYWFWELWLGLAMLAFGWSCWNLLLIVRRRA